MISTAAFMVCEVTIFTIEEDPGLVGHGAIKTDIQ
jgi:hypothetical protein